MTASNLPLGEGEPGLQVEIVDQAPGQPGVGPQLLFIESQAHQAAQFQAVGHMGLPAAHEVENRHAGFEQAAMQLPAMTAWARISTWPTRRGWA
jgi:hypothetical protein